MKTEFDLFLADFAGYLSLLVAFALLIMLVAGLVYCVRGTWHALASAARGPRYVDLECPRCRTEQTIERPADMPDRVTLVHRICNDCDDGGMHPEEWRTDRPFVTSGPVKVVEVERAPAHVPINVSRKIREEITLSQPRETTPLARP